MNDTRQENEFSIVIIPDTQILAAKHPDLYKTMTQWIKVHAADLNVQMVLHLGDVVHNGEKDEAQFQAADAAFATIDEAGLPLLITPGNHDYDNMLATDRSLSMYNRYFGPHRYGDRPWFGGCFEEGRAENCYFRREIGGGKFIFLSLEFGPRDEALAWADKILTEYADHSAIIITHCYMYMYGERTKPGDQHNPKSYAGAAGANDGDDQWHRSFKKHANLIAVFSGHQVRENVSYRSDLGDNGNPVFQSFQNWQCELNGGEGRIRIMRVRPESGEFSLQVVNPCTGEYETKEGYDVTVSLRQEAFHDHLRHPNSGPGQ